MTESGDEGLPGRVETWPEGGRFDGATEAILAFVDKLTLRLGEMVEADLAPLRAAGLGEEDILDVVMITGYYAYMNRVAQGLGVSLHEVQKAKRAGSG